MPKKIVLKIYGIALLATILMLLVFIFLNHYFDGSFWSGMKISKSALTTEYCELNNTSMFFHQRMNTYSNLSYFFLGIIVLLVSLYDKKDKSGNKNLLQQFPLLSFFYGMSLVYLCIGSSFFHASLTWLGQRVDMNGTYSICIALLGISLYRAFSRRDSSIAFKRIMIVVLFFTVLLFVELHLLISSIVLLPLIILLTTIFSSINYLRNKSQLHASFALLSLVLLIAACILRVLDVEKVGCDPASFYQGHSVWHIFTGMSSFFLYWFYRSERTIDLSSHT